MSEESTAADVVLDRDYPNVDFTPRAESKKDQRYVAVSPYYQQADFTPDPEYERRVAPRPHWFLRFYRMLRKLIRQRQESAVVKSVKWQWREGVKAERDRADSMQAAGIRVVESLRKEHATEIATRDKRIEQRDTALSELRQKMDLKVAELLETIASREKDIKDYAERDIPKLQRELEVSRAEVKYWKTLVAEKLIHEEAQIAVDNKRITDAEAIIEQLRNAATLQQLMERGR